MHIARYWKHLAGRMCVRSLDSVKDWHHFSAGRSALTSEDSCSVFLFLAERSVGNSQSLLSLTHLTQAAGSEEGSHFALVSRHRICRQVSICILRQATERPTHAL
jgi:hypothetical protein